MGAGICGIQDEGEYHDAVLLVDIGHLHAASAANGRVGDVAVASNLVGGVDNDDAAAAVVCEGACQLTDDGSLANTRSAKKEDGLRLCMAECSIGMA